MDIYAELCQCSHCDGNSLIVASLLFSPAELSLSRANPILVSESNRLQDQNTAQAIRLLQCGEVCHQANVVSRD
jgi:hypothetical protein